MTRKAGRWLVGGGLIAAIVIAGILARGALLGYALKTGARAAGYALSYSALRSSGSRVSMERPNITSNAGEPVLTADSLAVSYDLRHVFGSAHPYGITGIDIERPLLTYIKRRDGTSNITLPASNASSKTTGPIAIPQVHFTLHDGTIGIRDDTRIFAHSRRLVIKALNIDANLTPVAISQIALGLTLQDMDGTFPITGSGRLDAIRGIELSRIHAKSIGLSALLDYALNSVAFHVAGGVINNVDARIYGLRNHAGGMDRHVSVAAHLDHFQPYLGGIVKPLRDGRGSLRIYDRGLAIPKVDGSIAGVPVRIAGSIYDLSRPTFRLGITGAGDVRRLTTLSDAAKTLPLRGALAFKLFVEGDATKPLTIASFRAPTLAYGTYPLTGLDGAVALRGPETAILHTTVAYAAIGASVRGVLSLGKHTGVDLLAHVAAPAERLPFARDVLGTMPLAAIASVSGVDSHLRTAGELEGDTATTHLAGTFAIDGSGVGTIGPITLDGPGNRTLYARAALDRPHGGGGAAFVSLDNFRLATGGPEPTLPGLTLGPVPALTGSLDGDVALALDGHAVLAGGSLHASGVRAMGYPIDDLTAQGNVATSTTTPAQARVAANLHYRGALAPLARAAGGTIRATGTVDVPITVLARGSTDILAQIHDARFFNASVAGVGIRSLAGTVGVRGKTIDVYGVQAGIGNGSVVARGSFGTGGTLAVSTSGIDLATLRSAGLPVTSGSVAAIASIDGTAASPRVVGGLAISDIALASAQARGIAVDGNTGLSYADGRLGITNATLAAGPAVASIDGTVLGLRGDPTHARYDFSAHVREANIATLAAIAHATKLYPQGTADADVHVAGSGRAARIAGDLRVEEGSLNGLRYRDGRVAIAGTASDVHATSGSVTIGTSVLGFAANVTPATQSFDLHAPKVDLADFNDYFDPGDLLGGTGSIDAALTNAPNRIVTSGRVRIARGRLKHFTLGATRADWSTMGDTIHTTAAVGDTTGRVTLDGDVRLATTAPLRDALHRTNVAFATRASNVDLGVWLPAVGVQAPVLGFVNANAMVRGAYPNLDAGAHAELLRGLVRNVAVRTATIDATSAHGRATVTNAVLAIDNLQARATGTLALAPNGPFDLTIDSKTPDVAGLYATLSGKKIDASGTASDTLRLSGTVQRLAIRSTLDADAVRYQKYTVPHAHAELAVVPGRATLSNTEIDLERGKLLLAGFAPLKPNFAGVAPTAPVGLDLTAQAIDVAQFAAFSPKGTKITGVLDGRVGLVGSLDMPGSSGTLALTNGSFQGPQERSRISNLNVQLAFADRTVTVQSASANVGGGRIRATGSVSVPNLRDPANSATVALEAFSDNAVFDLPNLFRGRLSGNVTLARQAASDYLVGGSLGITSARIATSALLPKAATATSTAAPLPVDLNLSVDVADDVRVQGGPVDIGAKGDIVVGGTLGAPTADGTLTSTGGTLSFYRTFRVQYPSTVSFAPADGLVPTIDATATTVVPNPQTDVTLHVTGPATELNVGLDSDPAYSREQILGLLVGAQAFGAVSGVASSTQTGAQGSPFTALAEGQLGSLLTQNILEPFSSELGSAVGLSNLEVNYQPGGTLGLGAQKQIVKNVDAVFAESFGMPPRETIGLRATPNTSTALQLTFFSQPQSNRLQTFQAQNVRSTNESVTASQPSQGNGGFAFSFQRKFH